MAHFHHLGFKRLDSFLGGGGAKSVSVSGAGLEPSTPRFVLGMGAAPHLPHLQLEGSPATRYISGYWKVIHAC